MFNKIKKGKNLADVDNWLDTLGYYRKNVAYDETCLFRAVSEQLFECQVYHERVRKECIEFARENYKLFAQLLKSRECFYDRLNQLQKHMAVCGSFEFHIISRKYKCDILVFDGKKQVTENVTNYNYENTVLLCLMEDDHYDAIYKKDHIAIAGFCQSIVYTIFYEKVFNIENVDEIVRNMLYEKHNLVTVSELVKPELIESTEKDDNTNDDPNSSHSLLIAPFPFKVAKALDPNIYRNIEYDSWGETRRALRLGDWYYGDDKLIQGTRCVYKDPSSNEKYDCYIQEIIRDLNKCVVYLTTLAMKKTVSYSDLSPEDDAKPWVLPWRFTKSLTISNSSSQVPVEKSMPKTRKRGKDKKRTKSESSIVLNLPGTVETLDNVNAYIGVPLQMHICTENSSQISTESQTDICLQQTDTCVQQTDNFMQQADSFQDLNRCVWQQPQWSAYLPPTPGSYVWSPNSPPPTPFNYGMKPMVASAPVTPDVIPYHDPRYPIYYNYQVAEPEPMYTQWSSHVDGPLQYVKQEERAQGDQNNVESSIQLEIDHNSNIKTEIGCEESIHTHHLTKEKPNFALTITPQNPAIEIYSPVLPIHQRTPVIYTSTLAEVPEVMVPTSPIMYTPQVDVQYITPGPYIYPPTPPAAWCSPAVNAQGFIFPNPL